MTERNVGVLQDRVERYFWLAVIIILLAGLLFRLPGISARSLWIDELYTEWFSSRSFSDLWSEVPLYETHPPIYYIVLKLWTLVFGNSELGLRSLSLLASMLTIFVIALSGRFLKAGNTMTAAGLLGAALLAFNYASIRDAQNARPYALQTLICTVAILGALVLVMRLAKQQKWVPAAIALGVSTGIVLWFHNTSLFIAFGIWSGLALSLIVTPAGQRLRNFGIFVLAGILALLVWAPYVPIFIEQVGAFSELAFWLTPKVRDLYSAWMLLLGENRIALVLAIAVLAAGLFNIARRSPAFFLICAAILFLPLYTLLAVSFSFKPIYIQRLFAWMVPLALSVMAFGILSLSHRKWLRVLLACVVLSVAAARSFADIGRPIDDWKSIVAEIERNKQPGDVVIAVAAEGSIAVDYYARRYREFPPVVCVPGCYPQRNLPRIYMSNLGAPVIIEADEAIVGDALKTHGRVWLVQVSVALYDPGGIVRKRILEERKFVRYFGNSLAKVELFE